MTGKERFETVMNHKRSDKMPFMVPAIACTVASEILGRPTYGGTDSIHFAEELSLYYGDSAHAEFEEKYIEDAAALAKALRVDIVREVWRMKNRPDKRLDEYTLLFGDENGEHIVKRFYPATQTYGVIKNTYPPETSDSIIARVKKALEQPAPTMTREMAVNGISGSKRLFDRVRCEQYGEIIWGFGVPISLYAPAWLEAMALEPELLGEYVISGVNAEIKRMEYLADMGYRWFRGGGDLAGNSGPFFSAATCEKILSGALKQYSEACRRKNVIFCYNTDGNIWSIFDTLLTLPGVQAFGEVDRDAGMTVGAIRAKHPNLIILGNMSSALLQLATSEEIREDQRKQLEESEGLNFIPGPSNAILHGTPVRNIYAMIEEIERFVP